jgi:selT/selW/selH-like putative selenoprotein
MIIEV